MFQKYFSKTLSRVFQKYFMGAPWVLKASFMDLAFKDAARFFQECSKDVFRVFQACIWYFVFTKVVAATRAKGGLV